MNTTKKMGRMGAILAVAGFIAAPALLTGCDNTETSKRTSSTTTETPNQKVTETHKDTIKTTDKNNNDNNMNNPPPPPSNPR